MTLDFEKPVKAELEQATEECVLTIGMNLKAAIEKQIPKKPVMKAMNGFDSEVAAQLCCPDCGKSVINHWNKSVNPPHCMMCGQKLDWSDES